MSINSLRERPSPDSYSLRVAKAWSGERKVEDMLAIVRCKVGGGMKGGEFGYTFSEPEEERGGGVEVG